jgi:NADPH2:quinone reductase
LATWETSIEVLARRGIFVSFGNASGAVPAFPPLRLINKSGFLTRPKLNDYTVTREELLQRANDIYGWIHSGDLKVAVDRCFPLEQAVEGHDYLEAGKSRGKVLYEI